MEIISRSNQGFRTRPSFQKIANKPNKQINYVVNPNQAVRDSYEFSNLINGELDVEDEIKNEITAEMFHEQVKKEIDRQKNLEKDKEDRTRANLREGLGFPTGFPEMAAQQATAPETTGVNAPLFGAVPETFNIGSDQGDNNIDPMEEVKYKPSSIPNHGLFTSNPLIRNVPPQIMEVEKQLEPMQVDEPNVKMEKPEDIKMDISEEVVRKRKNEESKQERVRKAAKGSQVVFNIEDLFKSTDFTIPMIQQQMIMHGVDFNPKSKRNDLIMAIVSEIGSKRWSDQVEEQTIKKRLKHFFDEKGYLPIAIISEEGSYTGKEKRKTSTQETKTDTGASGSNDPPPPKIPKPPEETGAEEEDIEQYQQPPLRAPYRMKSIAPLRDFLLKAFHDGKITDKEDLKIWKANNNFKAYGKLDGAAKDFVIKNLQYLYKKYVYEPKKTALLKSPSSPKNVKKAKVKSK